MIEVPWRFQLIRFHCSHSGFYSQLTFALSTWLCEYSIWNYRHCGLTSSYKQLCNVPNTIFMWYYTLFYSTVVLVMCTPLWALLSTHCECLFSLFHRCSCTLYNSCPNGNCYYYHGNMGPHWQRNLLQPLNLLLQHHLVHCVPPWWDGTECCDWTRCINIQHHQPEAQHRLSNTYCWL